MVRRAEARCGKSGTGNYTAGEPCLGLARTGSERRVKPSMAGKTSLGEARHGMEGLKRRGDYTAGMGGQGTVRRGQARLGKPRQYMAGMARRDESWIGATRTGGAWNVKASRSNYTATKPLEINFLGGFLYFSPMELIILTKDQLSEIISHSVKEGIKSYIESIPKEELKKLYTSEEMRDMLQISRTTENDLNRKGILKFFKVGGRKRYTAEAIEAAIIDIEDDWRA